MIAERALAPLELVAHRAAPAGRASPAVVVRRASAGTIGAAGLATAAAAISQASAR